MRGSDLQITLTTPPRASSRPSSRTFSRRGVRAIQRVANAIITPARPAYSRLYLAGDGADWVLTNEMREVGRIARRLGISVGSDEHAEGVRRQSVLYASQFVLLEDRYFRVNRVGVSYFHGRDLTDPGFAACYRRLRQLHAAIARVHVSHSAMRDFVTTAGIEQAKVFRIPIGVNLDYFPPRKPESRLRSRRRFGVPESAVVVGSFQKDGVGWGDGEEPKLVKGPDTLLRVIERLRAEVAELFVLLSGPARGYVRRGLERLGVPYRHYYLKDYADVGDLYQALDLYLITSREEGGPKAVLESMASGVPLVTTRVGQAMDLVRRGENGWMVEPEDVDGLAHWSRHALEASGQRDEVLRRGRATAGAHAYDRQDGLWRSFFEGFVHWD